MFEKYDKAVTLYTASMRRDEWSETSIDSYTGTFRRFRASMEKHGFTEFCPEAVVSFANDGNWSVTTTNLYLTHLRELSNYGMAIRIFTETAVPDEIMPSKRKLSAAKQKEYSHILNEEQVEALLNADRPTYGRKPHTWLREKAEVTLLFQSGLRNSELRALTPADLYWDKRALYARVTKGDKPRIAPFPLASQEAVRAYLNSDIRPASAGDDEPLFGNVDRKTGEWKGHDRKSLSVLVKNYTASILGVEASCRTHALRHASASFLLEKGAPIESISEVLGHASPATTRIYAQRLTKTTIAESLSDILDAPVMQGRIHAV
jgi:site-specific recombinase XerD